MKRVGILMFQNMRYAPFLKMYENLLDSIDGVTHDVIYFDRDISLDETKDQHHIAIKWRGKGTLAAPKYEKLANFFFYGFDAKKLLKEKKYDFIIVLTSFPSVLLCNYLSNNYKGKFIVDIRDYTQEGFKPYFNREKKAFSNAAMCIISSPGFVNFLPKGKYYNCNNIDDSASETMRPEFAKATNRRIVISYIGSISYETQCKQLIDLVCADDRFEFHLYGNEANGTEVSEYVKQVSNPRVKMMGPFIPAEKPGIYSKSDLVFNCYGNERTLVKYAISNKYYDGAIYRKPLLVSPNTSMADFSGKFAYALDLGAVENLNGLYDWYLGLDKDEFEQYADVLIDKAIEENKELIAALMEQLNER